MDACKNASAEDIEEKEMTLKGHTWDKGQNIPCIKCGKIHKNGMYGKLHTESEKKLIGKKAINNISRTGHTGDHGNGTPCVKCGKIHKRTKGRTGHTYDHGRGDPCKLCGKIHINPMIGKHNIAAMKKGHIPWNKGKTGYSTSQKGRKLSEVARMNISFGLREIYKNGKVAWNKGLTKETNESLMKMSRSLLGHANPHKGETKETSESLRMVSQKLLGHKGWNEGLTKFTDERIAKTSEKLKRVERTIEWNEKNSKANKGKIIPLYVREKLKIARSKQIMPFNDSSIEVAIQEKLTELNIPFTKHKPFYLDGMYHQVDLFISPNVVIEADGCYIHGCRKCKPEHYLMHGKPIEERRQRDVIITQRLQAKGYIVLHFWEHDIKNNLEQVITKIKQYRYEVVIA